MKNTRRNYPKIQDLKRIDIPAVLHSTKHFFIRYFSNLGSRQETYGVEVSKQMHFLKFY